ncbi:hypothetical protein F891_01868 [Acinetobacter sp. CIP 101966]|uniref:tape measure protein n=1 Tax=Acinetobacter sp. CIP 101966 TaxID=1144662 RepID=UPI0002CEE5F1|nr:tape measure protein [Acinetobacter sp. CIP 101966]ENX27259.1 hypothetical protein F891_01868 [Acinetobacter sp. CIP 101966]
MATKLGTLTLDLVAKIGNFTQGMRQASSSAEREMQRASSSVNVMNGMLGKLAATAGAAFSVNQIKNYADSYTGMVNKLKLVTSTQSELSRAMDDTHKIAQATASDWNGVLDVYTKFQGLSKRLGIDQSEVARITETVTKTVSMSGQSAAASEAALLQFGQALNTGLLRGAELTSVLSQAPALAKALADGMGVAVGDLKKLGEEGKITSEVMRDALLKMSGSVDAEYAKTATTISASFNLITTEATKLIGEFDSATGASKTFVEGITTLSENMEGVVNSMMVGAAFMAGTYIPAIYSTITAGYAKTKQLIDQTAIQYGAINAERAAAASALAQAQAQIVNTRSTLTALAAEKALEVQRLQAQINAAGRMATTTRMAQLRRIEAQATAELVAAETALAAARARSAAAGTASAGVGRAALGVLFGPVGMGVAIATVAAGYLLMKGNADKATASIDTQGQSVSDLIEKYQELNTLQRDNETRALAQQVEDLSLKYRVAASDLFAFMEGLPIADEKINTFKKLNSELSQGRIDSNEYYEAIKNVNILTDDQLAKVSKLIGAYSDNKKELKAAERAQDALEKSMKKTTKEVKEQAAGVGELSEEIKKLLKASGQNIKDSAITSALASRGYNDTMIELAKKYLNVEGAIVKNEQGRLSLRADLQKMFTTEYNEVMRAKNATDARNEAEKRITQEKEKQAKLTKASTIDAVISSGEGNYNSVNLGQKGGYKASTRNLTDMTVAQILSAQRAKEFNAAGKYQTINSTLQEAVDKGVVSSAEKFTAEVQERIFKQYLVAIKRPEIKGFITGSNNATLNDALLGSAKEFASVANPSTGKSYYAGQGNNKASISAEKMTESLLAQQKVYRENIALGMDSEQAWLKSFNASTTVVKTEEVDLDKFLEDMIKRKQEQADEQKAIQVSYYNEWQNLEYDNQERIKEIEKAFATDPTERDRLLGLQQKAYEDDVANWIKAQDERVKAENEANQQILADRYKFLNDSVAMYDRIAGLSSGADEIFARATMSPEVYGQWSLANDRSNSQAALKKDRVGVEQDIMTSNLYSTDDERYEALKEAHQQYRDGLAAIDVKYYQGLEDLQNQTQAASLAGYGAMFGMMGSMLDAYGAKESTAYKVAFAMQKGFVLSSAILNAKGAIMSAWNDPSNVTMWQKIAGAAAVAVQTNDLMSAIQGVALSGMAHDGIDNIPKEGTWLLDKGERVVDSRTNADLKNYLANGGGSGGDVYYTQTIHIASDGSATSESDAKQLGKMMENMTLSVIRREQRQGGLLAK